MSRALPWVVVLGLAATSPLTAAADDGANVHPLDGVDPNPPVKAVLDARLLRCPRGASQRVEAFSERGRVWCETADGIAQGPFETWSAAGELLESGTRRDGELDGVWREWWRAGAPSIEAHYVDGVPDGAYRAWDADGGLLEQGSYRRGRRHGRWKLWRFDAANRRYPYGERGYYYGAQHGRWWGRDPVTGESYDVRFDRGRLHGHWLVHIDDRDGGGELHIEGSYRDGRRDGRWQYRDRQPHDVPHSRRIEAHFDHGVPHGRWRAWVDGALAGSIVYRAGHRVHDDEAVPSETIFDFAIDDELDEDPLRGRW